jgi:hypothetical protein
VNIKPYKNFFIQNGEIKKLVIEMLLNGIIQHSVNPFAPLALLVEKKDNTWRFYIDYKQLNNLTIETSSLFLSLMIS